MKSGLSVQRYQNPVVCHVRIYNQNGCGGKEFISIYHQPVWMNILYYENIENFGRY
jgi:hypothetical protein